MMYFNVFHRSGEGAHYEIYRRQQDLAHGLGLKTTNFLFYRDLLNDRALADAFADRKNHGSEIALSLHGINHGELAGISNGQISLWLLDRARKERVIATIVEKYREVVGEDPVAVANYHFDSSSLALLKEIAPSVETIIGGCFEEGVRVFHGCNHSWYLFNEGMPWNPWYPSKTHTLRPAENAEDAAGVVAVPHLMRDMSLAYEGRNDFWASHPPNVIRGMGNEATYCPYDLNLVDSFRMQEEWNGGTSYYNTFVSPSWLDWNHNSEYPPEVAWELYTKFLQYMASLKAEGKLIDMTLSEYGRWHRAHKPLGRPEVFLAKEILYGSGKHYFWYIDPKRRVLVDATQGGSIGDLRPYAGRVEVATGPDTAHRDIGSYPYLIHSQHRSGNAHHCYDGARTTLLVSDGRQTLDLCNFRTKVAAIETGDGDTTMILTPVELTFDSGLRATLTTGYRFLAAGGLWISRTISGLSDPAATLELTEYFKGAPGRTEYPEDLHGIRLIVDGESPAEKEFDYGGEWHVSKGARSVAALVPHTHTRVEWTLPGEAPTPVSAGFCAGHLFSPFFTLKLTHKLSGHGTLETCLNLTRYDS